MHFWIYHTAQCAEKIVSVCLCVGSASAERVGQEKVGQAGGWGHPQGDMHMVAGTFGCQSAMVVTRWANSCHGCTEMLRKHYFHLVGGSFLAGEGCLGSKQVFDNREC